MYNIKASSTNSNGLFVGGIIFLIIGLIISAIFSVIFIFSTSFYDSNADVRRVKWTKVYNSDGDTEYKPEIKFRFDGDYYICNPNYSSSFKHDIEKVYFNESNPEDCMVDLKEVLGKFIYLIMAIPAGFVLAGLIMLIKGIGRIKKFKLLKNNGILVKNIDCTVISSGVSTNNKRYVVINATYVFPDGTTKKLKQTLLTNVKDKPNKCDLLYLLEDYNVYYLDFNIEYESHTM